MSAPTILVIEDDRALRDGLALNFDLKGYEVHTASSGEEGLKKVFETRPDLVVLDIMLPDISGLDVLVELRERRETVPVLILSARGNTSDKVEGLKLGADDYLAKPFELPELLARAEAMLRRHRSAAGETNRISFGDVVIDLDLSRVTVRGEPVRLLAKEYEILRLLAESPGRPFTRAEILDRIWGWGFEGSPRTVDNFISSLRQKIEPDPARPRHIITLRQVGYKLEP